MTLPKLLRIVHEVVTAPENHYSDVYVQTSFAPEVARDGIRRGLLRQSEWSRRWNWDCPSVALTDAGMRWCRENPLPRRRPRVVRVRATSRSTP